MKKIILFLALSILLLLASCSAEKKDFNYGLRQIQSYAEKYDSKAGVPPDTKVEMNNLENDLKGLKSLKLDSGQDAFNLLLDYMILDLEAMQYLAEDAEKYGAYGSTRKGFGCKSRYRILNSTLLRNQSASKGEVAVKKLAQFIKEFPEEAVLANLSQKNKLFLNASYYSISKEAARDRSIIEHFCPENVTLEILNQETNKEKEISEE